MEILGLGKVTKDKSLDWYCSAPLPVPVLGGKKCRIAVEGYDDDPNKDEIHAAIANFLSLKPSVLKKAERFLFQYYEDCIDPSRAEDEDAVAIESAGDVWRHIQFGGEPLVTRRAYGDQGVYVSVECGCDWEEEHGLQIVFKNGLKVNKVGPYDGHLSNSDSYADESLEEVVYHPRG